MAVAPGTTEPTAPAGTATTAAPAGFRVTSEQPTAAELNSIIEFLVATPASDSAKAANLEGGMNAVIVPRTVYTLGLFRPPLGWHQVSDPKQDGDAITATLTSGSAGRPTIRVPIQFKRIDGNWRLSASSLCQGVKTVGLNIYCNQ
ncbi:hypothetical protein [Gordonia desulfuricans]|uniref:hypothetical protein n=1 Tax=Gordonia desulfuricans TaxID=89051 RepID=UPI00073EF61F